MIMFHSPQMYMIFGDTLPTSRNSTFIADDTIDESYGVAVVFHKVKDEGDRCGDGGRCRKSMVAQKVVEMNDEKEVEVE